MVKVFFADGGDLDQLRATLRAIADGGRGASVRDRGPGRGAAPRSPSGRTSARSTLPLQLEQETAVLRWARWALEQVESWKDTGDPGDWDGAASMRSVARRALDAVGPQP